MICDSIPFYVTALGVFLILLNLIVIILNTASRRRRRTSYAPMLLGILMLASVYFFGAEMVAFCKTLPIPGENEGLWIEVVYEDGSRESIPSAPQLFITISNKKPRNIEWHYSGPGEELKLWLYWNKPLTLGVTLWEKYVKPTEGTLIYNMSYQELKEAVERHAGTELWPSITQEPFEMDINFGADVKMPDGERKTIKYDHALKLKVSYTDVGEIEITSFRVSYAAEVVVVPQTFRSRRGIGFNAHGDTHDSRVSREYTLVLSKRGEG